MLIVKRILAETGMTQEQLANEIGVGLDRVKSLVYDRVKKLTPDEAFALIDRLGVNAEFIKTGIGCVFSETEQSTIKQPIKGFNKMPKRNWKKAQPRSLREALELCKDHAISVHRRSVERIAELAGEESHWTVYGWLRDGSIPAKKIHAFEHACGCDYITRYLAHSNGQLLINIPAGKLLHGEDVHELQATLNAAVGALLGFASGKLDADQVGAELNTALEALAWHRENVIKVSQPELEFGHE